MDTAIAWITSTTSSIAAIFALLAAVGVLRMPDLYSRMQAASKAATMGTTVAVIGCAVHFGSGAVAIRAAALILFLFLTVPLATHLIGRAGHLAGASLEEGSIVDDAAKEYRDRAETTSGSPETTSERAIPGDG